MSEKLDRRELIYRLKETSPNQRIAIQDYIGYSKHSHDQENFAINGVQNRLLKGK